MEKHMANVFSEAFINEIQEIKKALKYAKKVKSGKLKARPAEELIKELK